MKGSVALSTRLGLLALGLLVCVAVTTSVGKAEFVRQDTLEIDKSSQGDTATNADQGDEGGSSQHRYRLRYWHSLEGHLHNKIIHVPIGFGLAACFLSILALRWPEHTAGIRWLVLLAALGGIAAYFTGSHQALALEGGSKDWIIDLHRTLGITTASFLCLWAVSVWVASLRKWSVYLGILATVLLFVTGFFGGILAHG